MSSFLARDCARYKSSCPCEILRATALKSFQISVCVTSSGYCAHANIGKKFFQVTILYFLQQIKRYVITLGGLE